MAPAFPLIPTRVTSRGIPGSQGDTNVHSYPCTAVRRYLGMAVRPCDGTAVYTYRRTYGRLL